jgi:hypothetical protein
MLKQKVFFSWALQCLTPKAAANDYTKFYLMVKIKQKCDKIKMNIDRILLKFYDSIYS